MCAAQVVAGAHDDVGTCCFRYADKGPRIAAKALVGGVHDGASASSDEPVQLCGCHILGIEMHVVTT